MPRLLFLLIVVLLAPTAAVAQVETTLLTDIRPGGAGSAPWRVGAIGDTVLFMADSDGTLGPELWATDGAATWQVIVPPDTSIGQPKSLGVVEGEMYLMLGGVIWRTNGVDSDTVRVGVTGSRNYSACDGKYPSAALPTRIIFSAGGGCAVWAVNRDSSWSVMDPFAEGGAGPAVTEYVFGRGNDSYVFRAFDGVAGRRVYRTNGTPGDFNPVLDPEPDVSPRRWLTVALYNGSFYYESDRGTTGEELWRWDAAGTPIIVEDIAPGGATSTPRNAFVALGRLFFLATNAASGRELRSYDGVSLSTPFEIAAGGGPASTVTQVGHRAIGDDLYFWLRSGTDATDRFHLYRWDGTNVNVVTTGVGNNDFHEAGHLVEAGGVGWFDGCDISGTHGASLWRTDGSAAAVAVAGTPDVCTGARPFMAMSEVEGALLARVEDPAVGIEPHMVRFTGSVDVPGGPVESAWFLGVMPNPVRGTGVATLHLPAPGHVRVELLDVTGRRLATLTDGHLSAGRHVLQLPTLRAGTYVLRAGAARALVTVAH